MIRLMLCFNSFGKFVFTFIDHYIIHIPISTGILWKCSTPFPSLPYLAASFYFGDVAREKRNHHTA